MESRDIVTVCSDCGAPQVQCLRCGELLCVECDDVYAHLKDHDLKDHEEDE